MVKEYTMDIVITQASVAEEDKPHAADTSGETFSSSPATGIVKEEERKQNGT